MKPVQMINAASDVRIIFSVSNAPGDVIVNITKKEARRLVRVHELDNENDEIGSVHLNADGVASIIFST